MRDGENRERGEYAKAKVRSTGQLLSETNAGVDYLGGSVYADAIAESIHRAKTSITIGIYAKWGSGKSFLLRHVESILKKYQAQSVVDGAHNDGSVKTTYGCSKGRKLLLWIVILLAVLGFMAISLIFAIDPAILLLFPQDIESSSGGVNSTDEEFNTTPSPLQEYQSRLSKLNLAGLVLIPVELLLLFIIGCFGRTWASKHHYDGFSLLMYGAFTKLPLHNRQREIVQDPGQAPANVLRYAPPGSERLAMAASENAQFPRKYIFVNFKAWEYAGSDTLWAAIVTKISDEIEAEFGTIATRLFRMITVKEVDKKKLGRTNKSIFVQFSTDVTKDDIRNMMMRYGVIDSLEPVDAKPDVGFKWWMISYQTDGEYRSAKDCLKVEEVAFRTRDPTKKTSASGPKRLSPERMSSRPLMHEVHEGIPLQNMRVGNEIDGDDEAKVPPGNESDEDDEAEVPPAQVDVLSKICCCCNRFCFHFVRHPVMQWKLPRLFWWITLPVCCLLIPVTAYITASAFNLDVYQTFRAVPMFGQVLLWLPASAAVALAVSKFAWAMCHSQRQRINQALDGTQGRMASQLGFMNMVKNEIQVMTNLIRCARFIQKKDYKVIISIDDLDRIDLKKVHSVLEAINILLSDKSSPFICLIAADPRIVVKCVEESLGSPMQKAKVSGREYLKKIITLPVCLPEIKDSYKRRYIAGMIDQSDRTVSFRINEKDNRDAANGSLDQVDGPRPNPEGLEHSKFLFECRKFLYENEELQRHLHGNPRNMKRIFNVVTMTTLIMDCLVKKQERQDFIRTKVKGNYVEEPNVQEIDRIVRTTRLAQDLVLWIVLVDQWPYRTSFIIQRMEDSEQRVAAGWTDEEIPNEWTIVDIYKNKVEGDLEKPEGELVTLDDDPDLFQTYLFLLGNRGFTKRSILSLLRLTINLDYSIRRTIAFSLKPPSISKKKSESKIAEAEREVIVDSESERSASIELANHEDHVTPEGTPEVIPETAC